MKNYIIVLFLGFGSALISCQEDNISKNLELNVRNLTENTRTLKVIAPISNDSVEFSINPKDTITYKWISPNTKGEGTFEFVSSDANFRQGYYSNGNIYLEGPLWVTLSSDSIEVNLKNF